MPRHIRQARIAIVANDGDQLAHIAQPLRRHHSELRQMCPQRIHQHRALAHQLLAATMQRRRRRLLRRLDRHKSHGRARNRLANRFRIGGIVLIACLRAKFSIVHAQSGTPYPPWGPWYSEEGVGPRVVPRGVERCVDHRLEGGVRILLKAYSGPITSKSCKAMDKIRD
jgi:hypothetical protein